MIRKSEKEVLNYSGTVAKMAVAHVLWIQMQAAWMWKYFNFLSVNMKVKISRNPKQSEKNNCISI